MAALGRRDRERERFFGRWIERLGRPEAVVFDITSLSSWARLVDLVEWGYNRDGEALPQVNLGLVFAQPVNLPIAYRVWPRNRMCPRVFRTSRGCSRRRGGSLRFSSYSSRNPGVRPVKRSQARS